MESIDAILYINLDHREDRKNGILRQIQRLGFNPDKVIRIPAVYDKMCGHIGCGKSHIKALEYAIQNDFKRIMILEDDFNFDITRERFDDYLTQAENMQWDVLLLALGHNSLQEKEGNLRKVNSCTTTSGYIVQQHYYETLLSNFAESVEIMLKQLDSHIAHYSDLWRTIGNEFDTINVQIDSRIRYGHPQGFWKEMIVDVSSFEANNTFFDCDPLPGHLKQVQCYDDSPKWQLIGYEGHKIDIPVGSRVRYGHPDGKWHDVITQDSSFIASNKYFGCDPHPYNCKQVHLYSNTPIIPKFIHGVHAIDFHWGTLQGRDKFYVFDPVVGHQGGFSSDTF